MIGTQIFQSPKLNYAISKIPFQKMVQTCIFYAKTMKGVRYILEVKQTALRVFEKGSSFTFRRQSISTLCDCNVFTFNRLKKMVTMQLLVEMNTGECKFTDLNRCFLCSLHTLTILNLKIKCTIKTMDFQQRPTMHTDSCPRMGF